MNRFPKIRFSQEVIQKDYRLILADLERGYMLDEASDKLRLLIEKLYTDRPDGFQDPMLIYVRSMGRFEFEQAQKALDRVHDAAIKRFGAESNEVATVFEHLGTVKVFIDQQSAIDAFQHGIALREKVLGKDHPDTIRIRYMLGFIHHHIWNNHEESLRLCLDLVDVTGPTWPAYPELLSIIAISYRIIGMLQDAEAVWRELLRMPHRDGYQYAMHNYQLGNTLYAMNRFKEAREPLQSAYHFFNVTKQTLELLEVGYTLVDCLTALEDQEAAESVFQRCLQVSAYSGIPPRRQAKTPPPLLQRIFGSIFT